MAIVCIKIGENEPDTYAKFDRLSKHMDIIEVLPRKRDKQGKLLERTMGAKADKHYFGLNVDMSSLADEEFRVLCEMLREEWFELREDVSTPGEKHLFIKNKRLRYLDISSAKMGNIGLSQATVDEINQKGVLHRQKKPIDMTELNKYHLVVSFEKFAKNVVNKETGETLEEELGLSGKTIKSCIANVKLREIK